MDRLSNKHLKLKRGISKANQLGSPLVFRPLHDKIAMITGMMMAGNINVIRFYLI